MLPQMSDHAVTAPGARRKHGRVGGWPPALHPGRLWPWAAIIAGFPLLFLCGLRGAGQLSVQSDGAATARSIRSTSASLASLVWFRTHTAAIQLAPLLTASSARARDCTSWRWEEPRSAPG